MQGEAIWRKARDDLPPGQDAEADTMFRELRVPLDELEEFEREAGPESDNSDESNIAAAQAEDETGDDIKMTEKDDIAIARARKGTGRR